MIFGPENAFVIHLLSKCQNIQLPNHKCTKITSRLNKLELPKNLSSEDTCIGDLCAILYIIWCIFDGDIISFYYDILDRNIDRMMMFLSACC